MQYVLIISRMHISELLMIIILKNNIHLSVEATDSRTLHVFAWDSTPKLHFQIQIWKFC